MTFEPGEQTNVPDAGRRKGRWLIFLVAIATIPATVLFNSHALKHRAEAPRVEEATHKPVVTTLDTTAATHRAVVTVHGESVPRYEVALVSEVTGRVLTVSPHLEAGGTVAAGEVLVVLEDVDFLSAVADARSAVADAQLNLGQEQRQAEQARRDWQRAGFDEEPSDLALRKPQLESAHARLEAARASLARAEDNLADTRLTAPFDAIVAERSIAPGGFVSTGSPVATLYATDEIRVSLALSATQWRLLSQAGELPEQITLSPTDGGFGRWDARAIHWDGAVDRSTRQRRLIIAVDRPLRQDPPLLPGTFVRAEIPGPELSGLLRVPASAVTAEGFLLYVDEQERLQRTPAEVVFSHDQHLYVKLPAGPSPTDRPSGEPNRATLRVVRHPLASYLPGLVVDARQSMEPEGEPS